MRSRERGCTMNGSGWEDFAALRGSRVDPPKTSSLWRKNHLKLTCFTYATREEQILIFSSLEIHYAARPGCELFNKGLHFREVLRQTSTTLDLEPTDHSLSRARCLCLGRFSMEIIHRLSFRWSTSKK